MLDKYLRVETIVVIFVGDFNPMIFQPSWLSAKGLIREDEATAAKVDVIHNEITRYEIGDWLQFEVTRDRCSFTTLKEPYFEPMRDLMTGIYKILRETPIRALGINNVYDLSLKSPEDYFLFGSKLTPLDFWTDNLNDPRLLQLEIFEKEKENKDKNFNASRRIRITPSSDQRNSFGVSININNHYDLIGAKDAEPSIVLLNDNWEVSFSYSRKIVEDLLKKIFN